VDWVAGNYAIVKRNGRAGGALKLSQRMVSEGSVIVSPAAPEGRCLDVAPLGAGHPVLRPGFAVALPIPWQVAP